MLWIRNVRCSIQQSIILQMYASDDHVYCHDCWLCYIYFPNFGFSIHCNMVVTKIAKIRDRDKISWIYPAFTTFGLLFVLCLFATIQYGIMSFPCQNPASAPTSDGSFKLVTGCVLCSFESKLGSYLVLVNGCEPMFVFLSLKIVN